MKKCKKCLIIKKAIEFQTNVNSCKKCISIYKKEYYKKNKEVILNKVKNYNILNEEKIKKYKEIYNKENPNNEYHENYRKENKEKIKEYKKIYAILNKDKLKYYQKLNKNKINLKRKENRDNNKEYFLQRERQYVRNRKLNNPVFKLSCSIRTLITQSFKYQYTNKSKKTTEILGCNFNSFKEHIESQFDKNMNWENYATYWQLDHKIPISWAKTENDVYLLNHYTNFQPMYWKDNIVKGNRWSD